MKLWIYQINKLEKRSGFYLTNIEGGKKKKENFQNPYREEVSISRDMFSN